MKLNHHGKATPLKFPEYKRLRNGFLLPCHQLLLDIAYYTGERWGAILRLHVSDVYSAPSIRDIHPDITFRKNTRKDKTTRQCPISDALRLRLEAYQPSIDAYLFPSPLLPGQHLSDRVTVYGRRSLRPQTSKSSSVQRLHIRD